MCIKYPLIPGQKSVFKLDDQTLRNTACFKSSFLVITDWIEIYPRLNDEKAVGMFFHIPLTQSSPNIQTIGLVFSDIDRVTRNHETVVSANRSRVIAAATIKGMDSVCNSGPSPSCDKASPNSIAVFRHSDRLNKLSIMGIHH